MKTLHPRTTLTAIALATAITSGLAQTQPQAGQQPPDSAVAVVADARGLAYVPPDQRPFFGTFWEVRSSLPCITVPLPCPPLDPNMPVYAIGDPVAGGQFLVDGTMGQVISPQVQYGRSTLSTMDSASILQAQVNELQNFVAQVQARQADAQLRANRQINSLDGPPPPGQGGGTNSEPGGITFNACQYTTNDLWLEIITLTNATGCCVIHPPSFEATNCVYDLFMTTNLSANGPGLNLTNWLWLLRTDPGETNLVVPALTAEIAAFLLARTNDADGDGMSDAYEHLAGHTDPNTPDGPLILGQPLSQAIYEGDTVTFSVIAEGPAPLTYQWNFNGAAIPGETNTSLTLLNAQGGHAGDYSVQVTGSADLCTLSSNASLDLMA